MKVFAAEVVQEKEQKRACETDFQKKQEGNAFHDQASRKKNQQQVQRTCSIVGEQVQEIETAGSVPGIEQAVARLEHVLQLAQKRHELVVHVNDGDLIVPKRKNSGNRKSQSPEEDRQEESCENQLVRYETP